jgi:hypothetical protein
MVRSISLNKTKKEKSMPTNEELKGAYNAEQLRNNIIEKKGKIYEYRTGLDVLYNSAIPDDPFIKGRISHLEEKITDYEQAISDWESLLASIEARA